MGGTLSVDLDFDDGQQALADALSAFCRDRRDQGNPRGEDASFPRPLWRELAGLGVLAIGTPEGEGAALELAAAMESLGHSIFPGPLVASVFAVRVLPEKLRRGVASGEAVVCLATPPELPFAPVADVFLEVDVAARRAWLAELDGPAEPVGTLGAEPWGRGALRRGSMLDGFGDALAAADVARAAYLASAGRRLIEEAADHARTRRQFGRAIGEFQGVAHPLASSIIALDGARSLARMAAYRLDHGEAGGDAWAAAARISATRAAVDAIHVGHQVFGAVGITLEGPAFAITRRIRQVASSPPSDDAARPAVLSAFSPFPETEARP